MGIARAVGDEPGDRAARHGAGGLHQHLQVVTVGETPQDLADVVAGEGAEEFGFGGNGGAGHG